MRARPVADGASAKWRPVDQSVQVSGAVDEAGDVELTVPGLTGAAQSRPSVLVK